MVRIIYASHPGSLQEGTCELGIPSVGIPQVLGIASAMVNEVLKHLEFPAVLYTDILQIRK